MREIRTYEQAAANARSRSAEARFGIGVACWRNVTGVDAAGLSEDGTRVRCVLSDGEGVATADVFVFRARSYLESEVVEQEVELRAGAYDVARRLPDFAEALRRGLSFENIWLESRAA
jgi:hypothetical protein